VMEWYWQEKTEYAGVMEWYWQGKTEYEAVMEWYWQWKQSMKQWWNNTDRGNRVWSSDGMTLAGENRVWSSDGMTLTGENRVCRNGGVKVTGEDRTKKLKLSHYTPAQALSGQVDTLPGFPDNRHMMVAGSSALHTGRLLPHERSHLFWRLNRPQDHKSGERFKCMRNLKDHIGNLTLDLPACTALPASTVLPRTPKTAKYPEKNPSQCHFVYQKPPMEWPGIEPGYPKWAAGNWLSETALWF
jgi:hypothetical protein